jgi:demethylmenaquinone methyltransferase/2-methoxy-6-polyprenyl-1,4-benzoquinol methylase
MTRRRPGWQPYQGPRSDFGFSEVAPEEKTERVKEVFDSVASRYDIMNDLMSLGLHRLWKRWAVALAGALPGQRVLDVAGGTGDLARQLAKDVGYHGLVTLLDINASMLACGRDRLLDKGIAAPLVFAQGNAEQLPFSEATFDVVTVAFGLRNMTHKAAALAEMRRVLRPGGRLVILEFSKPRLDVVRRFYDRYSFTALPFYGRLVAGDAASYRYLAESIRRHPDQEALAEMMDAAGLQDITYYNLALGIVAIHRGFRA